MKASPNITINHPKKQQAIKVEIAPLNPQYVTLNNLLKILKLIPPISKVKSIVSVFDICSSP